MSLFKRGNVWWSYFYEDGIRHQSSTGTSNRRQAETIEAKLKEEVTNQRFQIVKADPTMTFGDLAARFLASGSVRPHHIYHLKFLLPFFADTAVLRVTKSLADEFRRRRQAGKSTKDATVNRDLSVLRHILYWGVDEQLLLANPLARLKMARERRIRRQVLSVAEEILLLAAAKDHLRAMIIAALDTGMRRGEITSQRWEDIDFSRKLLFVTRSKTPEGESREIPLTERLHEHLLENRKDTGLVINFRGPPGPHREAHVEDRAQKRRSPPHPFPRSPPHLQHSPDGGRRPAGNPHGAHGPFLGLESALDLHPHRASGQAQSHPEARSVGQPATGGTRNKEHDNASTETDRSETGPGPEAGRPQTVEEEDAR